jgi:outer membrane protein TolC
MLSVLALGTMGGCKLYHALPLDQKARDAALSRPDLPRIQVQAKELRHPLLKPLAIDTDLRDGLSPAGAAVLAVLLNPDLRAVRDQRALADAQLLDAGLLPDPVLSYGYDVPVGGSAPEITIGHTTDLSLDLTSVLTRGLRRRSARAAQQSVDLDVAWQEWQVAEAAKLSVYRLSALDPQVGLAEEAAGALGEILGAVEKAAARGQMSQNDLASARAAFDAGRREALSVRQTRDRERLELNALLGLPPRESLTLAAKKPQEKRPWDSPPTEGALLQGLEGRLDLVALQKGYESQDARVRLAVWSQFPTIGISLNRAVDTSSVGTKGYGATVSLPLLNRGRGLVAMENATRQQMYDQYLARLFHARSDLAQILSDMGALRGMIAAAAEALPALRAQAEASEAAFRSGNLDLVGRNQARLALLAQRGTLLGLEANLDELGVALEIASGRTLQPEEGNR